MIANYHNHTYRCNHADGEEREYIEKAIESGIKTLGFSDHAPMPLTDGHYSGFRMTLDQFPDYMETLLARVYGPVSLQLCKNRCGQDRIVMLKEDAE